MLPLNVANILAEQEEEHLEEIRAFNRERRLMREASDPFSLSNEHFKQLFRLTKDMAQYVLNRILPLINVTNNAVAVPSHLRFFATLYFFSTGSYQRGIGQSYNISMSQQIVSRTLVEVTEAIINEFGEEWIHFPTSNLEKNRLKARFMEMTGFPGVIGAVDCTHVAILAPTEEHNYLNRKGYDSKNVQIVCDYDLKILNINAQFPGATHDAFIWRVSFVQRELERAYNRGDRNSWLLGDSGYPQQPWLMTPILNAQPDTPEFNYTQAHARARNCVERCNGVLKGRFRCILGERTLRYGPGKVGNIINACAILHNICISGHLEIDFDIPPPPPREHHDFVEDVTQEGNLARRNLVNEYFV